MRFSKILFINKQLIVEVVRSVRNGNYLIHQLILMLAAVGASVKVSNHQLKMVRRNKYLAQTLDMPFYALII
jgi:hypothetical protein